MILSWFKKYLFLDNIEHDIDVDSLDQSLDMIKISATEVCKEAVNTVNAIQNLKTLKLTNGQGRKD